MPRGATPLPHNKYAEVAKAKNLTVLEPYVTALTKIKHVCGVCSNIFKVRPNDVKSCKKGNRCPECKKATLRGLYFKGHTAFIDQLRICNPTIKALGKYKGSTQSIKCMCRTCNLVWLPAPADILRGSGCPDCGRRKTMANMSKCKQHVLGRRIVTVQGYEPFALGYLQRWYKPREIEVCSNGKVPIIRLGERSRHFPDIYIPSRNHIYEVKSPYTFAGTKDYFKRIKLKARKAMEQGYKYTVLVFSRKGKKLTLPKEWFSLTYSEFMRIWKYSF